MNKLSPEVCWLITDMQDATLGSSVAEHAGIESQQWDPLTWGQREDAGLSWQRCQVRHHLHIRKVETWTAVFSGYHPLQSTYGLATGQDSLVPVACPCLAAPVRQCWGCLSPLDRIPPSRDSWEAHTYRAIRAPTWHLTSTTWQAPMMPKSARHGFCGLWPRAS